MDFMRSKENRSRQRRQWRDDRGRKWSEGEASGKRGDKYRSKERGGGGGERGGWREMRSNSRRRNGRDKSGRNEERGSKSNKESDMPEWAMDEGDDDFEFGKSSLEADRARFKEKHGIESSKQAPAKDKEKSGDSQIHSKSEEKKIEKRETSGKPRKNDEADIDKMFAGFNSKMNLNDLALPGLQYRRKSEPQTRSRFGFELKDPEADPGHRQPQKRSMFGHSERAQTDQPQPSQPPRRSRFGFALNGGDGSKTKGAAPTGHNDGASKLSLQELFGKQPKGASQGRENKDSRHAGVDHKAPPTLPSLPHLPDLPDMFPGENAPKSARLSAKQLFLMQNQAAKRENERMMRNGKVENVHAVEYNQRPHHPPNFYQPHHHTESPNVNRNPHNYGQAYNQGYGRRMAAPSHPHPSHGPPGMPPGLPHYTPPATQPPREMQHQQYLEQRQYHQGHHHQQPRQHQQQRQAQQRRAQHQQQQHWNRGNVTYSTTQGPPGGYPMQPEYSGGHGAQQQRKDDQQSSGFQKLFGHMI
uniref:Uncharacterized protein n=1 Tax=Lotharella oceanica TaxID=641309 RepID=A0A7S2XDG9_9EUKA